MIYSNSSEIITFEAVNGSTTQIKALYHLLKIRTHNISHKSIPTFEQHAQFVINNPYRVWYLLAGNDGYFGTVYVAENNNIGINMDSSRLIDILKIIIKKIESEIRPLPPITSIRNEKFTINVPISNQIMISAIKEIGYEPIQITFSI
jgi:hypothetical protein